MTHFVVTLVLLVLTAANIGVASVDLRGWNFVLNLLIAAVEVVIMVWWFMGLRWSSPITKLAAVAALVWLAILISGTLEDLLTRAWLG